MRFRYPVILIMTVLFFFARAYLFAEGEIRGLKDLTYWDNGKIKACIVYDKNGRLMARAFCRYDGTVEKAERFDREGHKIEEALFDQAGALKTGIDGWAAMRWWYDEGVVRVQISYDEHGRPLERRVYSESGRLIVRQQRHDVETDPYEEAAMAMLLGAHNMKFYDSRTRLNETMKFMQE